MAALAEDCEGAGVSGRQRRATWDAAFGVAAWAGAVALEETLDAQLGLWRRRRKGAEGGSAEADRTCCTLCCALGDYALPAAPAPSPQPPPSPSAPPVLVAGLGRPRHTRFAQPEILPPSPPLPTDGRPPPPTPIRRPLRSSAPQCLCVEGGGGGAACEEQGCYARCWGGCSRPPPCSPRFLTHRGLPTWAARAEVAAAQVAAASALAAPAWAQCARRRTSEVRARGGAFCRCRGC